LEFGKIVISYTVIIVAFIVLILGAVTIGFYAWYRISLWRKRLRRETKEVPQSVAKAFRALREEVQEQIEYLDRKPGLSKAEKEIRDKLQEALDISEAFIGKEIKDVEKELE
jgi:type VI protein secretion system component VasK